MNMINRTTRTLLVLLCVIPIMLQASEPDILPLEKRAEVINNLLKIRLDTVLPDVMRRTNIDMWLIICREYNEDPVFPTLAPATSFAARRTTMLVFYDRGDEGIEKIAVSRYDIGDIYKSVWNPDTIDQWSCLANVIKERDPETIGINESETFAFGDGLSASHKQKLVQVLGEKYAARLQSAENLAVGWLETRTPQELEVYPQIVAIAHDIIAQAFSNKVITPGVTSVEDVKWWIRQRITDLGLKTWFHPSVDIQRQKGLFEEDAEKMIIHRGDLLHCDIGVTYLRLNTDTQEHAYVLKRGEEDVPSGLKQALKRGNRLQDILTDEFVQGRTGNEILKAALDAANEEEIKASIYTHPLGYHGHAAGPTIGLWDNQQFVPGKGEYPLYYNTCYAIELNAKVDLPEWDGQEVKIALEQDAVFTKDGVFYLDDRQTSYHIIK